MLRIEQLHLKLNEPVSELPKKISKRLGIAEPESWRIVRESVDARDKSDIRFSYTVDFETANEEKLLKRAVKRKNLNLKEAPKLSYSIPHSGYEKNKELPQSLRPVIAGFGPCGMFAALMLAEAGLCPIIIERGRKVEERAKDVDRFWKTGELNPESNVQFGEGGAGTFSDGKLTTGIKDVRIAHVNEKLIEAGADEKISYSNMPHIGTDVLRKIVVNIRKKIISLGGEIRFESKLSNVEFSDGVLTAVTINDDERIECANLILSIGNSAADTVEMLYKAGVKMEAKPFSVGARIEHPQLCIDEAQYGEHRNDSEGRLGAAAYKLSHHCADGRGVYTFCMCPGGHVIAAASELEAVVTNGMSYHARNAINANSALLVSINPEDYMPIETNNPIAGFEFQRNLERKAYELGGGGYKAPVQRVGDFMNGKPSIEESGHSVIPSYKPDVKWGSIEDCLPEFVISAMREAIPQMAKKLRGFDLEDAIFTAVETRSSSPVRILRERESLEAVGLSGLYPGGEGAGYAGGIMSAAVDGIKMAEAVIKKIVSYDDK